MALSAFKSTTRRRGIHGNSNDQDAAGHARTPSDYLTAHHHKLKYGHRRSSSFTDVSPYSRYSGDASPRFRAPRTLRFLDRQLSESDLARSKPTGDIEGTPSASKRGDEAIHRLGSPQVMEADTATRPKLQRSISGHDKNLRDHPEGPVEEKIIRAVHAQNKPKQSVSLSSNRNELYDIIKAEVFDVVADMKEAIEMTQEKALSESSARESADMSNTSLSEEIVKMFRYVCKGYVTKIDKAEEEVNHLRKQLAEKERICLDLTNLINELIPDYGALQAHEATPLKQGNSRQVLKNAAAEAIEPSARSRSILDDEACLKRLSGEEILLELEKETERRRLRCLQSTSSAHCKSTLKENKDGLVLPWLTCEEANNVPWHLSKESAFQAEQETSLHSLKEEDSIKQEDPNIESNTLQGKAIPPSEWKKTCKMNGNVKPTCIAESSLLYIQSAELISQRIQFRARVEAGELLLCIGTLHIH